MVRVKQKPRAQDPGRKEQTLVATKLLSHDAARVQNTPWHFNFLPRVPALARSAYGGFKAHWSCEEPALHAAQFGARTTRHESSLRKQSDGS